MKIAHLSDTHIGHTRYARVGAKGINQREIDVFATLRQALKAIEDRDPDLVLHTGDFFDKLRPSNQSLYHSFQLLAKFQERRGYRPFVIVAGNHETPRMAESFSPLMLLGMIQGVKVFVDRAVAHPFDELDLEILAIPDNGLHAEQKLDWVPTLGRKHRVLAVHGLESTVNQISDF
ncbi:MAG: metallophosphoesterase family protein, partial [Fimbriimonas sp.]